ncbi:MAG: hypothetical protein HY288_10970 [Planctomycetia bacterium]|nr:hypothetical protein [Planctomycetia bacterium]
MNPIAATSDTLATGATAALASGSLALLGGAALVWRKPALRGTTLVVPWYWSAVSLAAISLTEILVSLTVSFPPQPWVVPLRFAAAMSSFCPLMALLGAKRPQDRAWQFIVFSLWAILSLPSVEWLLFGGVQEMHPARFWFLAILICTGALNGTASRFWPSSWLVCLGQMALVMPFFSATQSWLPDSRGPQLGLLAIVAGWGLLAAGLPRGGTAATRLDRMWLDFRDAFGVVWSLRVAERINAASAIVGWPVTLGWRGFYAPDGPSASVPEMPAAVEESFRALLRRFVSPEWIDQRLIDPTRREPVSPPNDRPTTSVR